MKKLFMFICIITFLSCSQKKSNDYIEYNKNIEESRYLLFKGDSAKADSLLTAQVYSIKRPFLRDIRNLIKLRIQISRFDQLDNLVKLGFKSGLSKEYLFYDSIVRSYYQSNWENKFPKYENSRKEYFETIDTTYRTIIINLIKADQKYRSLTTEDSRRIDSLRKENDAKVLDILKKLIKEKGYFGFSKIGEDILWGDNAFIANEIFFRHLEPDTNRIYFYDILKKAVLNGDLYPSSYSGIIDYDWLKRNAFKQLYGTTAFTYKNCNYAFPLINNAKIDSIRGEIGLIDWNRNLEIYNMKYDTTLILW
jgi:hypothetical protein